MGVMVWQCRGDDGGGVRGGRGVDVLRNHYVCRFLTVVALKICLFTCRGLL